MLHTAAGHSSIGKVKKNNEDALLIDEAIGLYLVCDGLGGRAAGAMASTTACELIRQGLGEHLDVFQAYTRTPSSENRQQAVMVLKSVIQSVSLRIHRLGCENPKLTGMASTVAALLICGKNALVAHAGDSRVYLQRGEQAYLITRDHSVVGRQLQHGMISPEDALHGANVGLITRALGMAEELEVETLAVELLPGDLFLMCSDGLSRYVSTEEINRGARQFAPTDLARKLVALAEERNGSDNITAIAIRIDPDQKLEGVGPEAKIAALKQIALFQNLTYLEAIQVLSLVSSRTCQAGERIVEQGSPCEHLYVGVSGRFRIELDGEKLSEMPEGFSFGEMSLLLDQPNLVSVTAVQPSRLLMIHRGDLMNLLNHEPALAQKFLWSFSRSLAAQLVKTGRQLVKFKAPEDSGRIKAAAARPAPVRRPRTAKAPRLAPAAKPVS